MSNFTQLFQAFKIMKVEIIGINIKDLVEGKVKKILSLLWSLMRYDYISK